MKMTDITMVGLGAMGSALTRAFPGAEHKITVWNRTQTKMEALLNLGANGTSEIAGAIKARSIIVICIDNYEIAKNLILHNYKNYAS